MTTQALDADGPGPAFGGRYPAPGGRLGRYELLTVLGEGGMGRVYRARDGNTGGEVALKVLPRDLRLNPEDRARFAREVGILAGLGFRAGVAPIYDHGEADGWLYYVMGLVAGPTLAAAAAELPREARLRLVAAAARTVGRIHAAGVCHRDLKPSNIVMDGEQPVLIDFGIARQLDPETAIRVTRPGSTVGTVAYLAPEKPSELGTDPEAAKAADVYALGVIAYELACGVLPYRIENLGDEPLEAFAVIREGAGDIRDQAPDLPEPLAAAIMAALARDWRQRPAAASFGERLEAALGGCAVTTPPRGKRRAGWLALAAGVLLLLAAGAALFGHHRRAARTAAGESVEETRGTVTELPVADPEVILDPGPRPAPLPADARPLLSLGQAPPALAARWQALDSDATLVGRGVLLWALPAGASGRIRRGEEVLEQLDGDAGHYLHRGDGDRLEIELRLPGRDRPLRLPWQPRYDRVDTLHIMR